MNRHDKRAINIQKAIEAAKPVPKKRGRPKKVKEEPPLEDSPSEVSEDTSE